MTSTASLINFPTHFPLKVIGKNTPDFETTVLNIVHKHFPNLAENALGQRLSGKNNYLALTITIIANSQQQLDNLYQDLSAEPLVLMAL